MRIFAFILSSVLICSSAGAQPNSESPNSSLQSRYRCEFLESVFREDIFGDGIEAAAFEAMPGEIADHLEACASADHGYSSWVLGMTRVAGFPQGYFSEAEAFDFFEEAVRDGYLDAGIWGLLLLGEAAIGEDDTNLEFDPQRANGLADLLEQQGYDAQNLRPLIASMSRIAELRSGQEGLEEQGAEMIAELEELETRMRGLESEIGVVCDQLRALGDSRESCDLSSR